MKFTGSPSSGVEEDTFTVGASTSAKIQSSILLLYWYKVSRGLSLAGINFRERLGRKLSFAGINFRE